MMWLPSAGKVMIAGDWHANARWAVRAIHEGCGQLDDPKIILQLGDFGLWRTEGAFIDKVNEALLETDMTLCFIDGNHEDHAYLAKLMESVTTGSALKIAERIWYLPRGFRWKWHERQWLALGGAASVDRAFRTEGHSWFREEEISLIQAGIVAMRGPADVMITHECPRKVSEHLPLGPPYHGWDLEVSRSHQELLDRIIMHIEPEYLFHGHMHLAHQGTFSYPFGKLQVRGLNCDGHKENWAILDTKLMAWVEDP